MTTLICRLLIVLNRALAAGALFAAAKERGMDAVIAGRWPSPAAGLRAAFAVKNMMAGVTAGARRGWARVLVAFACALVAGVASAGDTSRSQFAVWAVGLPSANFLMEYQAAAIHVTADDVARGVVQVQGGSRLVVTADSPTGYAVDFYTVGKLLQAVQIDGIGSAVELGPKGGTVVHQEAAAGRRVIALNYRFFLAPDATPGTYAWPLELVVRGVGRSDPQRLGGDRRQVTQTGRAEP